MLSINDACQLHQESEIDLIYLLTFNTLLFTIDLRTIHAIDTLVGLLLNDVSIYPL